MFHNLQIRFCDSSEDLVFALCLFYGPKPRSEFLLFAQAEFHVAPGHLGVAASASP